MDSIKGKNKANLPAGEVGHLVNHHPSFLPSSLEVLACLVQKPAPPVTLHQSLLISQCQERRLQSPMSKLESSLQDLRLYF